MDQEFQRLIASYEEAMKNRSKAAVYRISVKLFQLEYPGQAVDIAKLHAVNRTYAKEMHGWDMP